MTEIHKTASATLWWREDGFWHFRAHEHSEITREEAEAFLRAMRAFLGDRKAPLLIDRSHSYSPHHLSLLHFREMAPQLYTAIAYYVPTVRRRNVSEYEAEVFIRGIDHIGFFRTLEEAEDYLRQFV